MLTLLLIALNTHLSFAQLVCPTTASDGTPVNVTYAVDSQTQLGNGLCAYELSVTLSTADGSPAATDISAVSSVSFGGTSVTFNITLQAGKSTKTLPNQSMPQDLPCGIEVMVSTQVAGGGSCEDQIAVLPVELVYFETAPTQDNAVKLIWETASETDNLGFEIQRSVDAYKWESLTFVKGAGNTLQRQQYSWIDTKPLSREYTYYRLKQLDVDEEYEYSSILVHKATKAAALSAYPNPVRDHLVIELGAVEFAAQDLDIQVFNVVGKQVKHFSVGGNESQLYLNDLGDLEAGMYWIVIGVQDDAAYRYKVTFLKD
ncbi:MAG: T9SS type A sorting domain-containing protein [Bacteroidota bacterium]